jgi:hypothetical protein
VELTGTPPNQTAKVTGTLNRTQMDALMQDNKANILDLSGATADLYVTNNKNWPSDRKKIILPDNLTSSQLASQAFQGSEYLEEIEISPANPTYMTDDNVLYNKYKTQLVHYPAARVGTTFTVPNTVTSFAYGAFGRSQKLKTLTLVRSMSLNSLTCFGYSSVEEIIGDTYIDRVQAYSFQYSKLKHITLNVTSGFGTDLFRGCTQLEWVALPNATTPPALGGYNSNPHDFVGCSALTAVYVPSGSVNAYQNHSAIGTYNPAAAVTVGWKYVNEMRRPVVQDIIKDIADKL